jgi:tRNA threonylcarbamoyladenosine biosynthesis protein TsaB
VIVLAIDTATSATVLGLRSGGGEALEARDDPPAGARPGHSTRLLPLASELIAQAGLSWRQIDRIAVGIGPGTFTGLRVGIATAHGLAQSSGAELVGVSSLQALALRAHPGARDPVLAAIDARRGEIFIAGYQGGVELLPPRALPPGALSDLLAERASELAGGHCTAVGDGALLYRAAFEQAGASVPATESALHRIGAGALCELGARAVPGEGPVLPDYLRRPDAAIALEGAAC